MEPYKNLNGNSSVAAYEIGPDSITVQFNDDSIYLYNYQSTGTYNTEVMKSLAIEGRGLNAFINQYTLYKYARRLK